MEGQRPTGAGGGRGGPGRACDRRPALHRRAQLGPVAYGNIGARERLDFTVIGAAVNLASRIEAVAKGLGEPLVATAAVAAGGRARGAASAGTSCVG